MKKVTQKQRILQLFKQNIDREIDHRLIVDKRPLGLGITGYSERITDIREMFGCTCGEDPKLCSAGEHIINTRKGYYKYVLEGRAKGETSKSRPSPSFETISISKTQAINNTKKRIKNNPNDEFFQKLLKWQESIKVSDWEESVANNLL